MSDLMDDIDDLFAPFEGRDTRPRPVMDWSTATGRDAEIRDALAARPEVLAYRQARLEADPAEDDGTADSTDPTD
jgi:hypothetical protein